MTVPARHYRGTHRKRRTLRAWLRGRKETS